MTGATRWDQADHRAAFLQPRELTDDIRPYDDGLTRLERQLLRQVELARFVLETAEDRQAALLLLAPLPRSSASILPDLLPAILRRVEQRPHKPAQDPSRPSPDSAPSTDAESIA